MCSVALGLYGRFLERTIGRDKGVTQDRTSTINVI
jgi:hypothetical protein